MSNRYTQITPSAYNPMSLQEIMLAPSLQRKQHDDTNAKIQEYLASLSSIDPHDQHWEAAQAEKQRLTEELDRNASQLAQKGFSPDITDNIMRFNRDYQESVSPTGKLGQIHAEKKNIQAQEDLFRQNYAPTYGGDRVEEILAEEMNKYRQQPIFDDKGRITSYKPRQLAKYQDYLAEADKYFTRANITSDDWAKINSGLAKTEDGRFEYVATTTEEQNWANNNSQLQSALDFMNQRIINPTGDLHQTILDQGRSPEDVLQDINTMMGIYKKQSTGEKEGTTWSNLMSTGGGDKQEPVKGVTVTNAGTYSFTEDFETLSANTTKILEDPQASPVDKAKARDTQKLITDIENELTDPESPYYDEEYVDLEQTVQKTFSQLHPGSTKLLETMINHGIFDPVEHRRTKDEDGVIWSKVTFNTPDGLLNVEIPTEEFKELNTHFSNIRKTYSKLNNKRNERLNQHAYEELRYPVKHDKTSEGTLEAINLSRIGTINNLIAQHANITSDNIPQTLKLKPDDKLQLASLIIGASPSEIISTLPTQVGRDVGINVVMRLKDTDAKVGKTKIGNELISVFIPINASVEQVTGHTDSAMLTLSMLPEEYQESFKKMIDTRHISSTRNYEDLGQNAVPGKSILGNTFEGEGQIDFLENTDDPKNKYVVMYGKTENDSKFQPMTWESIFRYDVLEDESENSENYARAFKASRIEETLKNTSRKYRIPNTNQTLYDKYDLGSKDNADWMGLLNDLRYREIRLSHTQDVYEVTRLKAFERYE